MPKLIIQVPDAEPQTFELTEESASIGRAPENSISVDVAQCSRRHCQILKIPSGYEITDLKSRNGTRINGVRKDRHVLAHGDVIGIGEVKLTFHERDDAEVRIGAGGKADVDLGGDCLLVYVAGGRKGERVPLTRDRTTFGRSEKSTVVLKDTMASSHHCEITKEGDGYVLRDLGSTNGSVVNNDPVSETTLSHGASIRLGKTRFLFVDPAVADYQKALAAEEEAEAEAEWGMMRSQVDMGRVKRARRAAIMWILAFVVIFGGAAALFTMKPEFTKGLLGIRSEAVLTTHDRNSFKSDFSFEKNELKWLAPEGRQDEVRIVSSEGAGHQGSKALSIAGTAKGWPPTLVRIDEPVNVSGDSKLTFSAWMKAESGARGSVGVVWVTQGQEARLLTLSPWVTSRDWEEASVTVSPPGNADKAQFVLAVSGDDSAQVLVDDVALHPADAAPSHSGAMVMEKCGNFELQVTDAGGIGFLRGRDYRLWGGGVMGVSAKGDAVVHDVAFRLDRVQPGEGGAITLEGQLLAPEGHTAAATIEVRPTADTVTVNIDVAESLPSLASWGLGFRISRDFLRTMRDYSADKAGKVFFGKQDNPEELLSLHAREKADLKTLRAGGSVVALLGPADAGKRSYEVGTRLDELRRSAEDVLRRAKSARSGREYGRALGMLQRVTSEFPFDDLAGEARKVIELIEAVGTSRYQKLTAEFKAASAFSDVDDLARAKTVAAQLAAEFSPHKIGTSAVEVETQIATRIENIQGERVKGEAGQLVRRAEDFAKSGMGRLATLFANRVIEQFPGTEYATQAEEIKEKLK